MLWVSALVAILMPFAEPSPSHGDSWTGDMTIAPGQTLSEIARVCGVSVTDIELQNKLSGDVIYAGNHLRIPSTCSPTGTPPPPTTTPTVAPPTNTTTPAPSVMPTSAGLQRSTGETPVVIGAVVLAGLCAVAVLLLLLTMARSLARRSSSPPPSPRPPAAPRPPHGAPTEPALDDRRARVATVPEAPVPAPSPKPAALAARASGNRLHPLAGERQPLRAVVCAELTPRGVVAVAGGLWPAIWRGPADRVPRRGDQVWVRLESETGVLLLATDGDRNGAQGEER